MAPLPAEVLYLIFPQLVQQDQLECMTVCRQWHDIIHDFILFRFIYIDHPQQLDQLIERVKRDPFLGTKVEQLILDMEYTLKYNSDSILKLFPNLRIFVTQNSPFNPIVPFQSHSWCERIESMVEWDDILTVALLNSGLCKNLTYIAMVGDIEKSGTYVIEALANAPGLKILDLCSYDLSFQDFELLHRNLPVLETLILNEIQFERDSFPLDIKPATSMKVLRSTWIYMYNSNHLNLLLRYTSQKYTCLEELTLDLNELSPTNDDDDSWYEDVDGYSEDEMIDEVEAWAQYKARLTSYMTTLAPYLKTLNLEVNDDWQRDQSALFDFNILDECGCKIRTLALVNHVKASALESLAITTQVQYIQSLTLTSVETVGFVIPMKWLRHFIALKELHLRFSLWKFPPSHILNLTDLLENLRECQLETLELYNLKLELKDCSTIRPYPSLKKLVLSYVSFPVGTDIFLSRTFPNVKRLKLDRPFSKQEIFMLPNLELSYLKIINRSATENSPVMLITLDNNQRRLYGTSTKRHFSNQRRNIKKEMFPPPFVSSKDVDESDIIPMITITCKSVFNFIMRNCEAYTEK